MPLVESLERLITRPPQELPAWALHVQRSYQALMSELQELEGIQVTDVEEARSIHMVHRRVLNLRETILSEGGEIRPNFRAGSATGDMALVFFDSEACLKKVPENFLGVSFFTGWIIVNDGDSFQTVPPQEWCADPDIVRGVAKGLLSELPRGVRTAIKYS